MSDWNATYDAVGAANGGLDLEMPFAKLMTADALKAAIKDGRVKESTIDDKVRRILRTAIQFGWLDREQADLSISQYSMSGDRVALDEAREGITLLKNQNNLLPLDVKRMKTIAIVGPNAVTAVVGGGGSSSVTPFKADSFLAGFAEYLGERVKVMYAPGLLPFDELTNATDLRELKMMKKVGDAPFKDATGDRARHISNWSKNPANNGAGAQGKVVTTYHWTGTYVPSATGEYVVMGTSNDVDVYSVKVDGKEVVKKEKGAGRQVTNMATVTLPANQPAKVDVMYMTRSDKPHFGLAIFNKNEELPADSQQIIRNADAVVVAAGFQPELEGEGFDRTYTMPFRQNELIAKVASINPKTIVTVTAGGSVETAPWIGSVPALLHVYYPGQEGAKALAEIVFGERSPEGHLPFSWEKTLDQNPAQAHYDEEGGTKDSHYAEGLMLGYRYYTTMKQEPLFAFGHGLSYTNFAYSNLKVRKVSGDDVEVSFDLANKGGRDGAAVPQVYVGDSSAKVKRPAMELKQFTKVKLKAGAKQRVVLHLDRRAFEYYDVASKAWKLDAGQFSVNVGDASDKIAASATLMME